MQANNDKTMIALKEASTEVQAFVVDAQKEVKVIQDEYGSIVPDASTKDGYKHCKEVRTNVMPIKKKLEDVRQALKRPVLDMSKLIDGSLKPLIESLDGVYKPFEEEYRRIDNEKKLKKEQEAAAIQAAIDSISCNQVKVNDMSSSEIESEIERLSEMDMNPDVFQERINEAMEAYQQSMDFFSDCLTKQIAYEEQEKQRIELEKKQREIEQREAEIKRKEDEEKQKARDEQLKAEAAKQAEEKAKRDAEQAELRHNEQLERAEREKAEAEKRAAAAERERIAREEEQRKAEELAREKDRRHKASIHNAILEKLQGIGLSEEQSKSVIKLAASKKAASMYIQY